jgi:hypothetical protein
MVYFCFYTRSHSTPSRQHVIYEMCFSQLSSEEGARAGSLIESGASRTNRMESEVGVSNAPALRNLHGDYKVATWTTKIVTQVIRRKSW